ncbi:DUF2218 domain-containing protein [Aldersonia sp. NBC_00410]|uniref:DUF2218 domain-containing protein n=1 Tax=Aldersonia sp. NBC_00410 TaxID=2975954 RepID=UPI00224E9674|nr:DUF2218 domain-containing protein [Aldersonia sp. NBC_00410]MCX5044064.1 DUF2218 domain-containing protein [Aldersonia sp. NBC_00410]
MHTAEASIETSRPSRYLVQLCEHAAAMGRPHRHSPRVHLAGTLERREVRVSAEWSDTHGTVTLTPWGRCTIDAEPNTLTLRIEAADEEGLGRIQDVITRDFDRFGRRENLTVRWRRSETPDVAPGAGPAV